MSKEKTYVVYKLYFDNSDKFYIGKTCNIKSRIYNHKKESVSNKYNTYKNNWLKKHLSNNEELKYEILFETTNEQEAYEVEHKMIIQTSDKNVNCFYSIQHPSNKSESGLLRMAEIFGKEYILINKTGIVTEVLSLSRFARENNLNYKDLNACAKKQINSSQGYKVFFKEDWDDFSEKEKKEEIDSFKVYDQYKTEKFKSSGDNLRKEYTVITPSGNVDVVIGLSTYIKNNNLNDGNMFSALSRSKPYKGYHVFYKEIWDSFDNDTKNIYINKSKSYIKNGAKLYKITTPDGKINKVIGLVKYAKENNLHAPSLSSLATGKIKNYKGYKIEIQERLQEEIPVANSSNCWEPQTGKAVGNQQQSSRNRECSTTREKSRTLK